MPSIRMAREKFEMETEEFEERSSCLVCGGPLDLSADRTYPVGSLGTLCSGCASARGGRYDESEGCWRQLPDLAGLAAEIDGDARG